MSAAPRGKQKPRLEHVPRAEFSAGDDCIEFAATFGLHLDPWQQYVVRGALGEGADGNWQAFEVGLIVPRQNGKGSILEALELYWLFVCTEDRLILHSAHEFKTAREGFLRIRGLIEGHDKYKVQVRQFYASTGGECGIELYDGKRLRFVARSKGAGRGFSPDKLVLDEAYNLPETVIDAVLPSVGARPNPQVWYTSSAADFNIAPCDVLARVRRRGIKGLDDNLAYFEWSVPYDNAGFDGDPTDPRLWAISNPSLGIRKTADRIGKFQEAMSPEGFAREELGVGTWPIEDEADTAFGPGKWQACGREDGKRPKKPYALGIAVSMGRDSASLAAAAPKGKRVHVGAVGRDSGTEWVADEAARIQNKTDCMVVIDGKGPTAPLIPELERAGVRLTIARTDEVLDACGLMYDRVQQQQILHYNDPELNASVAGAQPRLVGDSGRWAWGRRLSAGDVAMLEAATLAAWAVETESEADPSAFYV